MQIASRSSAVAGGLQDRFRTVRQASVEITATLSAEDMMVQSTIEASPVKWHLAHSSWFFETFVLRDFAAGYQPFDPDFGWLFNSYYNSLGDMPEKKLRASFSRPSLDRIMAYRAYVDVAVSAMLERTLDDEASRRIRMGLEHEQQHLELIVTDVKHALFTNPLHPALREGNWQPPQTMAPPLQWQSFAPGLAEIGASPNGNIGDSFAFDNETPRHPVFVAPFQLASRLVTCAEYLGFLDDDGYRRPELWLSEGWTTMREGKWEAPLYWLRDATSRAGWSVYTVHGIRSLDDLSETPVCHLSFFEAEAFARWSGCRLPTEFEWEIAAEGAGQLGIASGNFFESAALHPLPPIQRDGLQQIFGDVWEWTQSPYTGYPGYKPLPGALGEYNGKFMSSQIILRGGSCATPLSHIRSSYRNFFGPATRWQFSGLRLAKDAIVNDEGISS